MPLRVQGIAPTTHDAVVVVPGIMGSELVDGAGKVRWGLAPSVLAKAWMTKRLDGLHVREKDLAGEGLLRASRLLRVPAYMPILGGLEPYTPLLDRVTHSCIDDRGVAEFPYDWRLSIEFNAAALVKRCELHLQAWRRIVAEERYADPNEVRITIVAHSMGGLITHYASKVLGLSALLRQVITLGTPYYGALKAVQILANGEGALVPRRAARELSRTCPGVHDLLPRYRCLIRGDALQPMSTADLVTVGVDPALSTDASDRWARLGLDTAKSNTQVPLRAVVGADQPTLQSAFINASEATFLTSLGGIDHGGDSTVYRQSGAPAGIAAHPLPQRHGTLAKSPEALTFIADKLVGADTGPPLGTRPIGADIPDLARASEPVTVRVTGTDANPIGVTVTSIALSTGVPTEWGFGKPVDSELHFRTLGLAPDLHRILVKAGGYSAVTDIMLVTAAP